MTLKLPTIIHSRHFFIFISLSHFVVACSIDPSSSKSSSDAGISLKKNVDIELFRQDLIKVFDSLSNAPVVIESDTIHSSNFIRTAYKLNDYQPYWFDEQGLKGDAMEFIAAIKEAKNDGLDPANYKLQEIEAYLNRFKVKEENEKSIQSFEKLLTSTFLTLSNDLLIGRHYQEEELKDWKNKNDSLIDFGVILNKTLSNHNIHEAFELMRPQHRYYKTFRKEYQRLDSLKNLGSLEKIGEINDSLVLGTSHPRLPALRRRLHYELGLPGDTISAIWDEEMIAAIKKFQHLHALKTTGFIDSATTSKLNLDAESKMKKLALNMERMRWLKHDFPEPYIWVDVPKMELDYVENHAVQFNMRTVVGRPGRPTTMLDARLENIVFSPPWTVPPTIMKEEVVPGIARRGGSYLARRGLKAYDRRGRIVNASMINAKNYKRFSIGQAPGYRSSLGEVKFNLPNPWSIYLHDTPHREDFVKSYRAYSSGCIRVHKPKQFAEFLLRDTTNYSYTKIDSICKRRETIFVPLKRNIMVHIVYLTNALDSAGNVMYLKDIYKWDKS